MIRGRDSAPFSLDLVDQCLWRGGQRVDLTPRAFAVLAFLAARPKRLVTKEELLDTIWAGTVVTDGVLKVCVREIRIALGDDAKAPSYVETAHRRGYRFIGDLPRHEGPVPAAHAVTRQGELPGVPLVGREDVLAQLDAQIAEALGGRRRLVLLSGPPGIGKTSVADEALRRASLHATIAIARGQCIEHYGAGEAYLPVLEALGRLLRGRNGEATARVLARRAPTWLEPLGLLERNGSRPEIEREILGATGARMMREMTEALEDLTVATPLVLVLEDLHWSDASTLDLLAAIARRHEPARLLVVATYRPGDVLAGHPLRGVVHELASHGLVEEIGLDVLDRSAVDTWLESRFPRHAFPAELAQALYRRTEGHPLFLVGAAELLVREGLVAHGQNGRPRFVGRIEQIADAVPESVRHVVERQFERLDATERLVLEAASVVGQEFSAAAVAEALQQEILEVEECCDALVARREVLRSAGVRTFPDGTASARYTFQHALQVDAVYRRIAPAKRGRWHQRIARGGERIFARSPEEVAAQLAVHYERAQDPGPAAVQRRRAATADLRRHATTEAAAHLERAIALVEDLPEPRRSSARIGVLEDLGLLRRSTGDLEGAAHAFEDMANVAAGAGEREQRVRALLYLASVLYWDDRARCLSCVERAVEIAEELGDALITSHARGYAAHWRLNLRGWSDADAADCEAAVAAARRAGDRGMLALHVVRLAYACILQGRHEEALAAAAEGEELALALGDGFDFLLGRFFRGWALLHLRRFDELRAALDDGIRLARRNGHEPWAALLEIEMAQMHVELGEPDAAIALAEPAVALARRAKGPTGQLLFHGLIALGAAQVAGGQLEQACASLAEVEERLSTPQAWMDGMLQFPLGVARARLALARGDGPGARREAKALRTRAAISGESTYLARADALESSSRERVRST